MLKLQLLKARQVLVRRDYIVDIAQDLFFRFGYENTSIDDIAHATELSKSTLYTYVRSKEELFMLIHLRGMKLRVINLTRKMSKGRTGIERVRIFGEEYYRFYKTNPGFLRLQMYEDCQSPDRRRIDPDLIDDYEDLLGRLIRLLRSAFELGIGDGTIVTGIDPGYLDKYFAYTLRTMLNVAFNPEKVKEIRSVFDEEQFYFQYMELFLASISGVHPDHAEVRRAL